MPHMYGRENISYGLRMRRGAVAEREERVEKALAMVKREHLGSLFFFQAEDGIRDLYVTGVQTCALPISCRPSCASARTRTADAPASSCWGMSSGASSTTVTLIPRASSPAAASSPSSPPPTRSEERRVGKECSAPACLHHYEKNE